MPLAPSWHDIALRLALTVVAGALLGLNRSERGHVAGVRTTVLVCLAASISMVEVNVLLLTTGKDSASFSVLDLMRLPLGVLTGMGFIGAGAIVRRGDAVSGVTTAAVLWLATGVGICLGGGQLVLGGGVTALTLASLPVLKAWESRIHAEHCGRLAVEATSEGPDEPEVRALLVAGGLGVVRSNVTYQKTRRGDLREILCDVRWRCPKKQSLPPPLVRELAERRGVRKVVWRG